MKPKILIFDIETTPILGRAYGVYNTDILHIVKDWSVYSWAAKWHGQKQVIFRGINTKTEKEILQELYDLVLQADILIAHNGDRFDIKKIKTRFAYYGFPPLPSLTTVDTLKILRKEFGLSKNSLDYACRYFRLERKAPSSQLDWIDKMESGDKKVWNKIKRYNVQDVKILELLHDKIAPYATTYPNLNIYQPEDGCNKCQSNNISKRGFGVTKTGKYQRYQCQDCGSWLRGKHQKITDIR